MLLFLMKKNNLIYIFIIFLVFLHIGSLYALIQFWSLSNFIYAVLTWQIFSTIGISVCYHRQICHKAFKTPNFVKAFHLFCALLSGQAGPIVWCHIHRLHHRYSDTEFDPHSPKEGFWDGHLGWIVNEKKRSKIPGILNPPTDLAHDKLLIFFQAIHYPFLVLLFFILYKIGGVELMLWQGCFRITLTLHSAWIINSACHIWGKRRFNTKDTSTNLHLLSFFTAGEALHNNHHKFPNSAKMSYSSDEFDLGYCYIKLLQILGLASDIKLISVDKVNDNK